MASYRVAEVASEYGILIDGQCMGRETRTGEATKCSLVELWDAFIHAFPFGHVELSSHLGGDTPEMTDSSSD